MDSQARVRACLRYTHTLAGEEKVASMLLWVVVFLLTSGLTLRQR